MLSEQSTVLFTRCQMNIESAAYSVYIIIVYIIMSEHLKYCTQKPNIDSVKLHIWT